MIIDAFPFFMEYDVLDIRLNTLDPYVDYFILVEASRTQSLEKKPFFFDINKVRYQKFLHKIIHIKLHDDECLNCSKDTWQMEHLQRESIRLGLNQLKTKPGDILMVSDCDEIPDLEGFDWRLSKSNYLALEMSYHTFYANLKTENKNWTGTVITSLHEYNWPMASPQNMRDMKDRCTRLSNSGWHLGYMGGKEVVYQKFFSCIEPHDKNLIVPYEKFSEEFDRKIRSDGSFLYSDKHDDNQKLIKCPIDYPNLPKYLVENKDTFRHLLFE